MDMVNNDVTLSKANVRSVGLNYKTPMDIVNNALTRDKARCGLKLVKTQYTYEDS